MKAALKTEDERSLPELFSDVTRESSELVRKEIELAKLEITQNVAGLKTAAASVVVAVPLLFTGFLVILAGAVLALDVALQRTWLSALMVGSAVSVVGTVALLGGTSGVKDAKLAPQRSIESLRDDKDMLEEHV